MRVQFTLAFIVFIAIDVGPLLLSRFSISSLFSSETSNTCGCRNLTNKPFIFLPAMGNLVRPLSHNALYFQIATTYLVVGACVTTNTYDVCGTQLAQYGRFLRYGLFVFAWL